MSTQAPARAAQGDDRALTVEREETKYLVESARLPELLDKIEAELPPHRFTGEAANRLPDARHFVTTIYFDTPSLSYLAAARHDPTSHVKVRAKEYYDLHPSLAELATEPTQILRYDPWLWFELKRRDGGATHKRRFRFPKAAAATLFEADRAPELLTDNPQEREDAEALINHVRSQPERVIPSTLVNYERRSFQNRDSTLRVTVDSGLAFFTVLEGLFSRKRPLSRSELGPARGREPRAIVEVKRRGELPSWLARALERSSGGAVSFSKFVASGEAVHGR